MSIFSDVSLQSNAPTVTTEATSNVILLNVNCSGKENTILDCVTEEDSQGGNSLVGCPFATVRCPPASRTRSKPKMHGKL